MYDSNYPSSKKRNAHQDTTYLPTAERSNYRDIQRTPKRQQVLTSPYNHGSNRVASAQRSIDEVIEQIAAKRTINRQAIEQVRNVNQEIASSLSSFNPAKSLHHPSEQKNRTADRTRDEYSRDHVATSHFQWQDDFKRSQRESASLTNENENLRSRLHEEVQRKNELLRYVKKLQGENAALRHSQAVPLYADISSVLEENRYLKDQLQNGASLPTEMLQELRRLKEENQLLRRDTIALLKKTS